jgi:hypothetical protein
MKILIDMNLPPRWVQWFANAGWEALHWSKVGLPTASDREIMVWARENGYIVFTTISISRLSWRPPKEKAPVSSRSVRKISSLNALEPWS